MVYSSIQGYTVVYSGILVVCVVLLLVKVMVGVYCNVYSGTH